MDVDICSKSRANGTLLLLSSKARQGKALVCKGKKTWKRLYEDVFFVNRKEAKTQTLSLTIYLSWQILISFRAFCAFPCTQSQNYIQKWRHSRLKKFPLKYQLQSFFKLNAPVYYNFESFSNFLPDVPMLVFLKGSLVFLWEIDKWDDKGTTRDDEVKKSCLWQPFNDRVCMMKKKFLLA